MKILLLSLLILLTSFFPILDVVQQENDGSALMPLGGGNHELYEKFAQAMVEASDGNDVHIVILPIAYNMSEDTDLDHLRDQIRIACEEIQDPNSICRVSLISRINQQAEIEQLETIFNDHLSAIILLSSNAGEAMGLISGSNIEEHLINAYESGTIIAGASSAGNLLSQEMINGYSDGFTEEQSFQFGSVDVWKNDDQQGLALGLTNSIIDTQIFQRNHLGRLLNSVTAPDTPHVGIGIDSYSGVVIKNEKLVQDLIGAYTTIVFDADTYQASNSIQYHGEGNLIRLRNVLFHMLAPGDFSYDLSILEHSLAPVATYIERPVQKMVTTDGAGKLILSGGGLIQQDNKKLLQRFVNLSGGKDAMIMILADGFATERAARAAARAYQSAIEVASKIIIISDTSPGLEEYPTNVSGILFIGQDPSLMHTDLLEDLRTLWQSGVHILADDAAAAVLGKYYVSMPPTPEDLNDAEAYNQETTLVGKAEIKAGLSLVDAMIETQLLDNNRWGRLISLAYQHPELIALGLNLNTFMVIESEITTIDGSNVVMSLDFQNSSLEIGENGGFVIANGLMDVFTPGEVLRYLDADSTMNYIPAETPSLATSTPLPSPTVITSLTQTLSLTPTPTYPPTDTIRPTKTIKPTRTPRPPPFIPPPTDINLTNAMIVVGIFAVIAVILGFWLNRKNL